MTHRPGHQNGDRFSRKQQFTGNRPRNENTRQYQQHQQQPYQQQAQNWDQDYTRQPYPGRSYASSYDEEYSAPSSAGSDYYSRNVDSERGLYTGDPNFSPESSAYGQSFGPEQAYPESRYYMTRPREPLPRFENENNMQNQRFSSEAWSGYGYGNQDRLPRASAYGDPNYAYGNQGRMTRASAYSEPNYSYGDQRMTHSAAYGDPGYVPSHDYQARVQGDYFSQPYSSERSGYEAGHRGKGPKGYMRSDERLKEDISERLANDYYIDASDIEVQSKDGTIILSGTVNNRGLKHRVEDIIERCHGVKDIDNRLKIKSQESAEQRSASLSQNAPGSQGNKKQ